MDEDQAVRQFSSTLVLYGFIAAVLSFPAILSTGMWARANGVSTDAMHIGHAIIIVGVSVTSALLLGVLRRQP